MALSDTDRATLSSYAEAVNRLNAVIGEYEPASRDTLPLEYVDELRNMRHLWLIYRYLAERHTAQLAPRGIQILYAKISNVLIGIYHLLREGYPGPAAMLVRSLFESYVHLKIILKEDTISRSKLFEDFMRIELEHTFKSATTRVDPQTLLDHNEKLAAVRSKYHPRKRPTMWCWSVVPGKNGNEPNFRELCQYLGQESYYDRLYGRLSAAIHPVPSYELFLTRDTGSPDMELGPQFSSRVKTISDLVIGLAVDSFIGVIEFLNPDDLRLLRAYVATQIRPKPKTDEDVE